MPNPTAITKAEALKRLAEWYFGSLIEQRNWEYAGRAWNPFHELDDAFELQARLNDEQWREFCWLLRPYGKAAPGEWARGCASATADQRTRACVKVIFGLEVEE